MKTKTPFSDLNKFETALWAVSSISIILSFALSGGKDVLTLVASLIGVTSLIFLAKGYVVGQILMLVFSVLYGIISFKFRYYGEMITYLGMTAPVAAATAISWHKHPYKGTRVVEVRKLNQTDCVKLLVFTAAVTLLFYFILRALKNNNLFYSTVSIATSFAASYLTYLRSPYYAIGYAANDVVLIILWVLASVEERKYVPMVVCFLMFFANDLYGYFNWKKMQRNQSE